MLRRYLFWLTFGLGLAGCEVFLPGAPQDDSLLAGPVEELTSEQLAAHLQGDAEFGRVFAVSDGLGPMFVSTSCESCHIGDGKGHGLTTLTRFGRYDAEGRWDAMVDVGGPQLQDKCISGYAAERLPVHATGIARFMPPAVTGLGFLEAVSDASILERSDPNDLDNDGISGRPHYIAPPTYFQPRAYNYAVEGKYIGRFGNKAASIDLRHQTTKAYKEDMGITSAYDPVEHYNHAVGDHTGDNVADPELPESIVNNVVFYLRTLRVPPRRNVEDPRVKLGERVFGDVGCGKCHAPSLTTGRSDVAALSERVIHPFTDLLLHDMGSELDDKYTEGDATTSEWRTPPLWGIGLAATTQGGSARYLHDGRASTLMQAIEMHGGEASAVLSAFRSRSHEDQAALITFLESL